MTGQRESWCQARDSLHVLPLTERQAFGYGNIPKSDIKTLCNFVVIEVIRLCFVINRMIIRLGFIKFSRRFTMCMNWLADWAFYFLDTVPWAG